MTNNQHPDRDIIDVTSIISNDQLQIPADPDLTAQEEDYDDSEEFQLGHRYKTLLNLKDEEVTWLNKFYSYRNAFNSIEGCEIAIVKLYLLAIKMLNKRLIKQDSSLEKELNVIRQKVKETIPLMGNQFEDYTDEEVMEYEERNIWSTIYKKAESVVRETWGHKRKISAWFDSFSQLATLHFNNQLEPLVDEIMEYLKPTIGETNEQMELDLNATTTTRWRERLTGITASYTKDRHAAVVEDLYRLGRQNLRNPTREHIYYEAAKFIAAYDKEESLRFYLNYIYHNQKSPKSDQKGLIKSVQKKLFTSETQVAQFQQIANTLMDDMNLLKALAQIDTLYTQTAASKRRKIELNQEQIRIVTDQHSGTVEALNLVLNDDIPESTTEEVIVITKRESPSLLNPLQLEFLKLFPEERQMKAAEVESFACGKGMFKNQLLDGINDACYELLDDVLIEEGDDHYMINPVYYNKIVA
jgi:hypothetical protein